MAVRTHQIPVPHPRQDRSGSARWLALAVLCVSILMVNLDSKNPAARRPDLAGAVLSMPA